MSYTFDVEDEKSRYLNFLGGPPVFFLLDM